MAKAKATDLIDDLPAARNGTSLDATLSEEQKQTLRAVVARFQQRAKQNDAPSIEGVQGKLASVGIRVGVVTLRRLCNGSRVI
jgi:hypothetical protein